MRLTFGAAILMIAVVGVTKWSIPTTIAAEGRSAEANGLSPRLQIGAATCVITPPIGSWVQGAGAARRAERIRDDLEANSLYLTDGKTPLLIISCDLAGLESAAVQPIREAISSETGIPPRQVLITCTHTHSGPSVIRTNYHFPVDVAYIKQLHDWLVRLAREAVDSAQPGKIGWGKGTAQIGFNRRVCWADGTHTMHGDARRPDFAGLEGPDDPSHLALFAVGDDNKPLAVVYHNTTHTTSFYGAGLYSSDFPDEARQILRHELGTIPVLYLNGPQGDIAMDNQLQRQNESREARLKRIGRMLADETLRLYRQADFLPSVVLGHEHKDLRIEVRLPDAKQLQEAREVLQQVDAGEKIGGMKLILAFGTVLLQERFGEQPVDTVPIHVVRIGDIALMTQPCELYCQFGLDIKRRSPTPLTAVVGLTDGYCGYCPTIAGILGGGYSGQPINWTRLEMLAGYRIVEAAGPMLSRLWHE